MGGSADFVSGAYEHTINMMAKKQPIKAVVLQAKFSAMALAMSKERAAKYHGAQDLKGWKIGVTAPGSSTNMYINNLLAKAGLKPTDVSIVGVGTSTGAYAALDKGEIDGLVNLDPVLTQLESTGRFVTVSDTRTEKGMQDVYGGDYMASVIYVNDEYIRKNPNTVQAVVNAMVRADKWIAKATPQQIVDLMPAGVQGGQPVALQGGAAEEHDRLLRGRDDVAQGRRERLQGAGAVRAVGEGRRQDGPEPDVRQFLREEGERQIRMMSPRRAATAANGLQHGPRSSASAVEFDRITCTFAARGAAASYTAVRDVTLAVGEGEFVSVVGPTGCGKSTLLNIGAGLLEASSGTVRVFGEPLSGINRRAGYMFQTEALMPWRSTLAQRRGGPRVPRAVARAEARRRGEDWLVRAWASSGFADRYPHQLSGGMKKRVALAQMLILDPKIQLLADGRALLRARHPDPLAHGERAARALLEHQPQERDLHHPRPRGGDLAFLLVDRVVVLSAGPATHPIGEFAIDLGQRPRDARGRDPPPRRASSRCTTASGTR